MGTEPDVEKLKELFTSFQCHGVVALIDYLASPEGSGIKKIGSGSLGLEGIENEIFLTEEDRIRSAWFRAKSLYIGSRDGSVTPLQWLAKLGAVFDRVSQRARRRFDAICREFAKIPQLKPVGDVEIWTRKGIFIVPPEAYKHDMSAEELRPYRVKQSKLLSDRDAKTERFDTPFESKTKH